ncbi:hypothetical protein [Desulfovibrio ferrophilus]|uniref:DUF4395 domain-containing protein n=1 Tax=Desulfovibrio ferrophilus TaxID=241368 RepID=A0A2Z6B1C9_9BACT|nr:hypothetical protein [Desulfovibrio ferrophilus]BBD09281.1 putative uncharacterized protein [Desulfovibrio ferrophilus]
MRSEHGQCAKVGGFSLKEKLFAQGTFNLAVIIGAYGMWVLSPILALGYLVYALGSFTLLMRYTICARCPHLLQAGDCLFLPASLARKIIATDRSGPLGLGEKIILYAAFVGTFLTPVILLSSPLLFWGYILFAGGCLVGLVLHFCKHCHNAVCPLNRRCEKVN